MKARARRKRQRRIVDITVRLRRKDGRRAGADEAKAALWAAHKIAQAGGNVVTALREWDIQAIDWRNTYASGKSKTFTYTDNVSEVLGNMGGILETAGLAGLRVALVNKGEQ